MRKFLLGCVLLSLQAGCKKEEVDRLPKATQEGKNTAGFLVDGRAFEPHEAVGVLSGVNPVNSSWQKTKAGPLLHISFNDRRSGRQESFGIAMLGVRKPGTYVLQEEPAIALGNLSPGYVVYFSDLLDSEAVFYSGPEAPATVIITRFDTVQNIVSGTFEATPQEEGGTRTVHITQGRFDVRFTR